MNILHVTLGFYPAQAWGGPVKIVHQNGRELVRRGHRVTVYCTNLLDKRHRIQRGTFEQHVDGMRIVYFHVWYLPWWPGTLGPFWPPRLPSYLGREISGFDVVHLNGYRSPMMVSAVRAARRARVPIISQPHGTLPIIVNSFWAKRLYDRVLGATELKDISALIALQESERQQALAHGIPESQIEIIPNGIDPQDRDRLPERGGFRRRWGLCPDRPLVLFLGRVNRKKGTDMLVEAFARLRRTDAQLVIAGPDDGQMSEVKDLIEQHGLAERVVLPGLLTGQEVLAAFQDSDVFVLPCRADTFPVAIMEACLAGTPMVITDRCEMAHLVGARVAEVVPFNAEAFARAIDKLLGDPDLYSRYKENCRTVLADTFSIQSVVNRLEALYARVVAENQRRS